MVLCGVCLVGLLVGPCVRITGQRVADIIIAGRVTRLVCENENFMVFFFGHYMF